MKIALLTTDNREQFKDYANPRPHFGMAPEALMHGFAQLPDVEVDVVSCVRQPVASPAHLAPNVRYHALVVPKLGWMTTGYHGCIRAVRRKLRELAPDIVHGQGTERDCAICAALSGFPSVITIHGNMRRIARVNRARPFSYAWLNAHLERWTLPRAGGVVCLSRHTEDAVKNLARRTWVVPNAVDERYFAVEPAPAAPPVVLCVASISRLKNQNRFIRALDELARRREFALVFVGGLSGEADYAAEFLELVRERTWCRHAGFASRDELSQHLARATMLALPSIEENCPMSILEAMAAGVPVVAARAGGMTDLVEEGITGLFCDPFEPASMAAAVEALLADPARAARMGRAGREQARERFLPRLIAARHVEIYREVLGR